MKLYSVRDIATGTYANPFAQQSHAAAIRSFKQLANDKQSQNMVAQFPSDYELYYVGRFDQDTGRLEEEQAPEKIANGQDMVGGA